MTPDDLITAIQARVLHDAFLEGSARYWERRARDFEAALPRRGDYTGQATPDQIDSRAAHCVAAAQACRNRATGLDGAAVRDLTDTLNDLTTRRATHPTPAGAAA